MKKMKTVFVILFFVLIIVLAAGFYGKDYYISYRLASAQTADEERQAIQLLRSWGCSGYEVILYDSNHGELKIQDPDWVKHVKLIQIKCGDRLICTRVVIDKKNLSLLLGE